MPWNDMGKTAGMRCNICTGCGRCAGMAGQIKELHVLREDLLHGSKPLTAADGERLVTADIGTTTIALRLYGCDGTVSAEYYRMNPQIKYGADVLSRIQAAERAEQREDMRRMALEEIEAALRSFERCLEPGEHMRMVLAGNTAMIYLLMGYDAGELGRTPFRASRLGAVQTGIGGVPCSIFPGQSAFVGGDITAGIYACGMHESEELTLLVDLGTNGEMVLGNRAGMLACATAAGPAFEGGVNRGVWGADMAGILARLLREGIVDGTGLLADSFFDGGVRIHDVCVTQASIRAVQLAKAAIAAGVRILAREYGLEEFSGIGRVVLAGGFGYHLRPEDAAAIGLLPPELAAKAVAGGNTALSGCLRAGRALLETEIESEALFAGMSAGGPWNLRTLNLAEHPDFEKWYIEAMDFA